MPHVILPWSGDPPENPRPKRNMRLRIGFLWGSVMKGGAVLTDKVALLSGFVGGSVLTYLLVASNLPLAWGVAVALVVVMVVFAVGAYRLWADAYEAAFRFCPTWEHIQTRADTLRALVNEHAERGQGFQRQFMAGHMAVTRRDFDRAVAAGYPPNFDRDRISGADLEDVRELINAFENVVQVWKEAEAEKLGGAHHAQ